MNRIAIRAAGFGLAAMCIARASADVTVTVDPGQAWLGYMNVFDLPSAGGVFQFGSPWGTADLTATFAGTTLTLGPNTIGDPNPYWYTPAGSPGSTGNKIMDANMYVEPAGSLPGQNVTFSGVVLSNTLFGNVDANGNGWTSVAFIKDFAPDFSTFNTITVPLNPGPFSITLATVNDPARHVQYGFETMGPCVWFTDVAPYGNIQVGPAVACPGDLTGDNQVSIDDLALLLSNFGTPSGATPNQGDLDGDGDVDLSDLTLLLSQFGSIC